MAAMRRACSSCMVKRINDIFVLGIKLLYFIFFSEDNWKKKVESYRQRFLDDELKRKELDKFRPKLFKDETFDTFRKLSID